VIQDVQHAKQAWLAHWEKSGVHVAAAIAQRLIRRELAQKPEITLTLIREALELAVGSSELRIQMNPGDHQALRPQVETLIAELSPLGSAELVADPQIRPGGCRVETRFGVIDQQFEAQLARIEEELT
jgi:flagellar assembly protein FliH